MLHKNKSNDGRVRNDHRSIIFVHLFSQYVGACLSVKIVRSFDVILQRNRVNRTFSSSVIERGVDDNQKVQRLSHIN